MLRRHTDHQNTTTEPLGNKTTPLDKVIVAVKAEKVISKTALAWALTHVVRPGDCVTLLAVFSDENSEKRRFWGFRRPNGGCRSCDRSKFPDRIAQISESCSQMVLQFHNQLDVRVRIKVISAISVGVVAAEAKNNGANWVILDKKLTQERKQCMEELHCNIVRIKGSQAKVLKLNLGYSEELQTPFISAASSPVLDAGKLQGHRMKHSTPVSSPEEPSTSYTRTSVENSFSSPSSGTSIFLVYERNPLFEGLDKGKYEHVHSRNGLDCSFSAMDPVGERIINLSRTPSSASDSDHTIFWIEQNHIVEKKVLEVGSCRNTTKMTRPTIAAEPDNFEEFSQDMVLPKLESSHKHNGDFDLKSSIREAVYLDKTSSTPPPLCSLCQHKAPAFGKPPRRFCYKELEEATDGFSDKKFLAEGGFGLVHRGVLRDGQVVAVKQLKFGGSQRDADFCREVRVLTCAQHRNVVLLIGFCVEGNKRLLVYEYICNGSLQFHLHGNKRKPLDWCSRLKIAIGTARGLRYLHEDCRVGCIIHRDLRPNNILLTHDFEPQVADFGLARLHSEWETSEEERVVGTSGYLAPEYFCGGKLTEKVDIYAFGLVLLELITGQKNSDLPHFGENDLLSEALYSLAAMEQSHFLVYKHQLLDPYLASFKPRILPYELQAMYRAASLCLQQDPDLRPPMSKVLRILEGGGTIVPLALDLNSVGSRSGHMQGLNSKVELDSGRRHSRRLSH